MNGPDYKKINIKNKMNDINITEFNPEGFEEMFKEAFNETNWIEEDKEETTEMDKVVTRKQFRNRRQPYTRGQRRIMRNEPCPCGSNIKFKKCCGNIINKKN